MLRNTPCSLVLALLLSPAAYAQLSTYVEFAERLDPFDPSSPVVLRVGVELQEAGLVGSTRKWVPDRIVIEQFTSSGALLKTWTDEEPACEGASDGWLVTHQDPSAPKAEEFTTSPEFWGVGTDSSNGPPVVYSLRSEELLGDEPLAPEGGAVSGLTYTLIDGTDWSVLIERVVEPVEVCPPRGPMS